MSIKNLFLKSFPVPSFLEMPVAGFEIGEDFIRFISISKNKYGRKEVESFGESDLPEGTIKDGFIEDKKTFVKIVSKFRKENNIKYVKISLPEKYSYTFSFFFRNAKSLERKRILEEVNKRVPENVPLEKDNYYFDFEITNSKFKNCVVYVYPKKKVDNILTVLGICGFVVIEITIETNALAQCCVNKNNNNLVSVLYIKENESVFSIVNFGVPYVTKTFGFGFNNFKNFIGREKIYLYQPLSVLQDYVKDYIDKWKGSQRFQGVDLDIKKIVVCGMVEGIEILPDYFSLNLDLDCHFVDVWQNILDIEKELPPINFKDSLKNAVNLGLIVK